MPRLRLAPLLLGLLLAGPAAAHDPGLSSVDLRWVEGGLEVRLRLEDADWSAAGTPAPGPDALRVSLDGEILAPTRSEVVAVADTHTELRLRYPALAAGLLRIEVPLLEVLPFGHRQYVSLRDAGGRQLADALLYAGSAGFEARLEAEPATAAARDALSMFALGVEHILTGYDHLLFLAALLLACGSFGSMARTVTAFTVAHSITLAAAVLGGFALPAQVVEPAIAASIVYAAGVTALTRGAGERLALTFGFGLVHGLGFAGLLAELGVGGGAAGEVAKPLLLFNLGVEAGQLAIAAPVLPLLLFLRRRPAFPAYGAPALSAGIAGLGIFWLLERTLLG